MLPLIGLLGGSVGSAVGGVVAKAMHGKRTRVLAHDLKVTAEELEATVKTLEDERHRVQELQDDSVMAERLEEERVKVAALEFEAAALQRENADLQRQLECTKAASEEQLVAYQQRLQQLQDKVTDIVNKLFSKAINENDASKELAELGCHVEYMEADQVLKEANAEQGEWDVERSCGLLLEDRERMRRLIAHGQPASRGMAPGLGTPMLVAGASAEGPSTRFPVVTFPQLKPPASRGVSIPPLRLQDLHPQSSSPAPVPRRVEASPSPDTHARDQMSLSLGFSPDLNKVGKTAAADADDQALRLEQVSKLPTIKFVYSTQGQQNKSWVAKLPVEGSTAAPAYMTSTSPVPTYRPERDDALLTSNEVSLVPKW